MAVRNWLYDRNLFEVRWVAVPVISVGNLTTGGTGKTPMVIFLSRMLQRLGVRPGVVLRGYGAREEQASDEERLLRESLPAVPIVANADRVAAADQAREQSARVLVADDAYQHRRLGRDLNVCLLDARCPFGHDALLPAGRLREPVSSLRRADVVVITRSDQTDGDGLEQIAARVKRYCPGTPMLTCRHRPAELVDMTGHPSELGAISGRRVLAFAGIARPEAFFDTLQQCGAAVVQTLSFPDHHHYLVSDLAALAERQTQSDAEWVLCTAKDAVKLDEEALSSAGLDARKVLALTIEIAFDERDQRVLENRLREVLADFSAKTLEAICISESAN